MTVRVLIGDIRDQIAAIPDGSVDLVFTSSPFWRLRAYLLAHHPLKGREIGTEATPGEFVDHLLDIVELLAPKLCGHRSMMWELGDTMAGSGGPGGDYDEGGQRHGQPRFEGTAQAQRRIGSGDERHRPQRSRSLSAGPKYAAAPVGTAPPHPQGDPPAWPLDKSLCLIPETFRFALVYGFNPLTGRQTPRWRARNVVRWARNNPVAGSLGRRNVEHRSGDGRYRPATTDLGRHLRRAQPLLRPRRVARRTEIRRGDRGKGGAGTARRDAEGLLADDLAGRLATLDDAAVDDPAVPLLLAVSDNGTEMKCRETRRFLAVCSIAQHFGRPSTPTDQAWIETLWGHVNYDIPTWPSTILACWPPSWNGSGSTTTPSVSMRPSGIDTEGRTPRPRRHDPKRPTRRPRTGRHRPPELAPQPPEPAMTITALTTTGLGRSPLLLIHSRQWD